MEFRPNFSVEESRTKVSHCTKETTRLETKEPTFTLGKVGAQYEAPLVQHADPSLHVGKRHMDAQGVML